MILPLDHMNVHYHVGVLQMSNLSCDILKLMMFIVPRSEWTSSLSTLSLPATWSCELINTNSIQFIDLSRVCVCQDFLYFINSFVCYFNILTFLPLNNLVIYVTSLSQHLKVIHCPWFLSQCLSSCFPFYFVLYHLIRLHSIYGSCIVLIIM
jgi:hypothetical protein